MSPEAISVSAFVSILNETLTFGYPEVVIQGEISGFKVNQSKWAFFDIKDEESTLPCFMPAYLLKVPVEDGMSVRVTGTPKLLKWGKFSFTVRSLEPAGEGELKRALELLKAKLTAEGLFDPARKRPLPSFPGRIGLVTSLNSAAYHDFMKIIQGRWGGLEIIAADVTVQGQSAPDSVVAALEHLNQLPQPVDLIVLIRGGGSLEDLAAFSSEPVVRAVAASRTPMIVGVGHEVDVGLADLAADVRAATPTDAARRAVPDRTEIGQKVGHLRAGLERGQQRRIEALGHRLVQSQTRLERFIDRPKAMVENYRHGLKRGLLSLEHRVYTLSRQIAHDSAIIERRIDEQAQSLAVRVTGLGRVLAGFDPGATLRRGYAIVRRGGQIIKGPAGLKGGDHLMIQLAKGELGAKVDDKQ
jgi:exodeoxyribonuclease VII large subunit